MRRRSSAGISTLSGLPNKIICVSCFLGVQLQKLWHLLCAEGAVYGAEQGQEELKVLC